MSTTRAVDQVAYFRSPKCKIWYQRVMETTEPKPRSMTEPELGVRAEQPPIRHSRKRQLRDEEEFDDDPAQFRRVRLKYSNQTGSKYLEQLLKFHKQRGTELLVKQPLAAYELKKAVARCGGFERVCKLKKWAEIGRGLGCSGRDTSPLWIRNSYQRWIHPYEEYLKATGGVSAATSAERPDSARHTRRQSFARDDIGSKRRPKDLLEKLGALFPTHDSDHPEGIQDEGKFKSTDFADLRHPIDSSYMPNAQLMYSSDDQSDCADPECPDLSAWIINPTGKPVTQVPLRDTPGGRINKKKPKDTRMKPRAKLQRKMLRRLPKVELSNIADNAYQEIIKEMDAAHRGEANSRDHGRSNYDDPDPSMLQHIAASFERQSF